MYLTIDKVNGYIEENSGNKYLTPIPTNKGKDKQRKYEELWDKMKDFLDQQLITKTIIMKII